MHDDIQYAVLTLLRNTAAVTALTSTRIYEEPDNNPASPYIVAGDMREERDLTMNSSTTSGTNIATVYFPLHICYSPDKTAAAPKTYYQAARSAAAAAEAVLHKAALTLPSSGWASILCIKDSEQERRTEDGGRYIEQTYKIIAYKTDAPPPTPPPT